MRNSSESFNIKKNNAILNKFKDTRRDKGVIKVREPNMSPYPSSNQTNLDYSHEAKKVELLDY